MAMSWIQMNGLGMVTRGLSVSLGQFVGLVWVS